MAVNSTNDRRILALTNQSTLNSLVDQQVPDTQVESGGIDKTAVVDITANELLVEILQELRYLRTHLELVTDHELTPTDIHHAHQ